MVPTVFTDAESRSAWNSGAESYGAFVDTGADYYRLLVHGPGLLDACGAVDGLRALDLGCGHGYFARELARRGARMSAIDLSDALIALARAREEREPLDIDYRAGSAAQADRLWPAGSFDLVTSCMALQDMADIPAVLGGAATLLAPRGRMVFSVPNPATDTAFREWERDADGRKVALRVDRYFDTGAAVCEWNMPRLQSHWRTPHWRHTLAEWSGLIADAGFLIRRMHEPRPTAEQVEATPALDDCRRMPYFLIFDLIRQPSG